MQLSPKARPSSCEEAVFGGDITDVLRLPTRSDSFRSGAASRSSEAPKVARLADALQFCYPEVLALE
jgi:hypothetical protein